MQSGIITFAVYEDGSEYMGLAKCTLPDVSHKTATISGAGLAGDIEVPMTGQTEAMSMTIDFIDNPPAAYRLSEPGVHTLDLRVPHNDLDPVSCSLRVRGYKHIVKVMPKTLKGGEIAPAATQGVSTDYTCIYRADYIDGKRKLLIDKLNNKYCGEDGVDLFEPVNAALGKPVTNRV